MKAIRRGRPVAVSTPSRGARHLADPRPRCRASATLLLISALALLLAALVSTAPASTIQPQSSPQEAVALLALQQAQLVAADGTAYDEFGFSVAVSGDTALVGAPTGDVGGNAEQGSVYVFVRVGTTWTFQQKLTAADGAAGDCFGCSVALSGDTALVGARYDVVDATDQGSAYVFTRSGISWTLQQKLTAADGAIGDSFGDFVALIGDTALVGAPQDDVSTNADQGSAYVFTRSGTSWTPQQQLTAADGAADDWFGRPVALSGDTALVGAPYHDVGVNANQGSAYVFTRSGASWNQQGAALTAAAGAAGDYFGFSVALSGETALVGAPYDGVGANAEQGSAYIFLLDSTAPTTAASFVPAANAAGWYKAPVTVTLSASDGASGPATSEYRPVGAAGWTPYAASFVVSTQGPSTWEYRSSDVAGNVEVAKTFTVHLDSTKPTTKAYAAAVKKGKKVKLAYKVSDAQLGCGQAAVTLKIYKGKKLKKSLKVGTSACNAKKKYSWRCTLSKGKYTVKVYATDIAGNAQSRVGSAKLTVK